MTQSPRLTNDTDKDLGQTTHSPEGPPTSASMMLLFTALDTTWRAFVPTIGGVFAGIGLDHLFNIAPVATIICLILGTALSALLITLQIRAVRRSR